MSVGTTGRLSGIARHLHRPMMTISAAPASLPKAEVPRPKFSVTPPPPSSPGQGSYVQTAAYLCIGDEILNGKTKDTNGNHLAKLLFDVGIDLKRIEVIPDEEEDIVEAAQRMVQQYDLVVSSGGIGPTHDDITYQSIARAFDPEGALTLDEETLKRMGALSQGRPNQTPEQEKARERMALFPAKHSEILFVREELWVPVVRMKGKLCILPGVPTLFERLSTALIAGGYVPLPPDSSKPYRYLTTTTLPESSIAPYLSELADRVKAEGIRVGSYPKFMGGVTVSLIGRDEKRLDELQQEVMKNVQGAKVEKGKLGEEKAT